jgi:hypothetical protein
VGSNPTRASKLLVSNQWKFRNGFVEFGLLAIGEPKQEVRISELRFKVQMNQGWGGVTPAKAKMSRKLCVNRKSANPGSIRASTSAA